MKREEIFTYQINEKYKKPVAYFSMEFAVDQALKIYSGGLGFLAGSHLRSAYELKQNMVGIGMLWKYGYYDQVRDVNGYMKVDFVKKDYSYLVDTGIMFTVPVNGKDVHVKAYMVKPETFGSAPLFLMTTDIGENDYLAQTITHYLYDSNEYTRVAQSIVLGIGGAMLLDLLQLTPAIYHMNEGHGVALNFYLYSKFKNLEEVKKRVVFTTHTPEMAGNEEHTYQLLKDMSFFYQLQINEVRSLLGMEGDYFNYTLAALKFSHKANGVSKLHGEVANQMWGKYPGICEITSITNAQNRSYWQDDAIAKAMLANDDKAIAGRKKEMKRQLFKVVADQTGKLFDENVLTIVWARRWAGYKRADMLMYNWDSFHGLVTNTQFPVQIIWAGKPYPKDDSSISLLNHIINSIASLPNCAVVTGYELSLSALLKKGSDVWLNNPRMYREASGTSGMTAAMNGSINLSIPDGWVPEFAKDGENCFVIQPSKDELGQEEKDRQEHDALISKLNDIVLPTYYKDQAKWSAIIKNAAGGVIPAFESGRMVNEYYEVMYK